jgi:hypothetical protein
MLVMGQARRSAGDLECIKLLFTSSNLDRLTGSRMFQDHLRDLGDRRTGHGIDPERKVRSLLSHGLVIWHLVASQLFRSRLAGRGDRLLFSFHRKEEFLFFESKKQGLQSL